MISEILVAAFLMFNPTITTIHPQPDAFNTSSVEDLEAFLKWSSVNDTMYDYDAYNCVNFSSDLIEELEYYGFESGKITLSPIGGTNDSHRIVYVLINDKFTFVEPQTDDIFIFDQLNGHYSNAFDYIQFDYQDEYWSYYYINFGEPNILINEVEL